MCVYAAACFRQIGCTDTVDTMDGMSCCSLRGQVYVGLSCHQPAVGLSGQMECLRGCTGLCVCAYVFRFEFATEG